MRRLVLWVLARVTWHFKNFGTPLYLRNGYFIFGACTEHKHFSHSMTNYPEMWAWSGSLDLNLIFVPFYGSGWYLDDNRQSPMDITATRFKFCTQIVYVKLFVSGRQRGLAWVTWPIWNFGTPSIFGIVKVRNFMFDTCTEHNIP